MQNKNIFNDINVNGYSIAKNVIPKKDVSEIKEKVIKVQKINNDLAEKDLNETRKKGHKIGVSGVGLLKQVVNHTQCFVQYLDHELVLGVAEMFFGDYVRISCTDCVINYPGNERGYWHADWPYNGTNSTHIKTPYPDVMMHLSTIWMLTDFNPDSGSTYFIPKSFLKNNNPSTNNIPNMNNMDSHPEQKQIFGDAGSVYLYDSRLWHAVATNNSDTPRVALIIRYAPWWLNLTPTMRGTPDNKRMVIDTGGKNYDSIPLKRNVYDSLPDNIKKLYMHWVID